MKTITIRINEELFKKAEARRGGRKKSEFYSSIIMEYIQDKPGEGEKEGEKKQIDIPDIAKENDSLKSELLFKDELMKRLKDERIKEMQNQLTFLQLEFQKLSTHLLNPPQEPRKWWDFWKKIRNETTLKQ
jgi:hypothetical protein